MFCIKCGKQIPDGSQTCPACGAQFNNTPASTAPVPTAAVGKIAAIPLSKPMIAKIALLLALILFFFPFVTVSCSGSGNAVSETYSGMQLITTAGSDDDELMNQSNSDAKTNIWLIAGFLAGAAGLAVLCLKKKAKIAAICSAVGAVSLALFRFTFKSYYDIAGSEYEKYIKIDFRFGLELCFLMFLISIGCCLLIHHEEQTNQPPST